MVAAGRSTVTDVGDTAASWQQVTCSRSGLLLAKAKQGANHELIGSLLYLPSSPSRLPEYQG